MSVRILPTCLIATALLAAGLVSHVLAHRASNGVDDGVTCPRCAECPASAATPCCAQLETRAYAVADLVIPCGNCCSSTPPPAPAVCTLPAPTACTTAAAPCPAAPPAANLQICSQPRTTEEQLIKLIVHTVAPESWKENGGKGTMEYFPLTMSLVVHQTSDVHAQIGETFKAMRQHQDVQVALEVRFVTVYEPSFERIGIDFECPKSSGAPLSCPKSCGAADEMKVTFLNEKQAGKLLEAVQSDPRANVMQAPKITTFNGQCAALNIGQQQSFTTGLHVKQIDGQVGFEPVCEIVATGLQMKVQPVVSADRKLVRIGFNASLNNLDSPEADLIPVQIPIQPMCGDGTPHKTAEPVLFTQFIQKPRLNKIAIDQALCIPDGGTAVLSGWKRIRESRTECATPVLSKIPYVNRLFKNVGYERKTEHLLVLVTPRIIVSAEEEKGLFEEEEEMCWPFGKETATSPAPSCCKEKCAVEEQSTGTIQIGAGVTSDAGFTGSIHLNTSFTCCEVAELLEKYHKACIEGRRAEATELAVRALALDPTCFHKAACGGKSEK